MTERHFALRHHRHHHHKHHPAPQPAPGGAIQWPSFTGQAQFVGVSPVYAASVYVDPSLGQPGIDNAQALLADVDRVSGLNDSIFGIQLSKGFPVNVIIFALGGQTDGTGGADHMGCTFAQGGNIEVCASFGDPARVSALFEAELSECAMNGELCGLSTGEALSRWCAMAAAPHALDDFETATAWVQAGMPDFVNQTDPSDQDAASIGCGMVFISWLLSAGVKLPDIASHMVGNGDNGTLADLFSTIDGQPQEQAWPLFQGAVAALPGGASGITSDDPFNALANAAAAA